MDKRRRELTQRQQKLLAGLSFAVFLLLSLLAAWEIGRPMLRLVRTPELFRGWVDAHGWLGRLLFVGMVILQVVIAVIPGEPLEIGAGYAFGFWEGTLLCLLGITIGSMLVFALVRRFGVRLVEVFFPRKDIRALRFLQDDRRRDLLIFLAMFIPGTPKDLLSYFVGLTDIRFSHWVWIAMIARIPSVVTSTAGGDAMGERKYLFAAVVFAATLLLSGAGLWVYRRLCRRQNRGDDPYDSPRASRHTQKTSRRTDEKNN